MPTTRPPQASSWEDEQRRGILIELARRRGEALAIFEPLPIQEKFFQNKAPEVLVRGSVRSGKTLTAAIEIARAVTGQDPYDKYPKANGRCYIAGPNFPHIGTVIYPKLFRAGAFLMIRSKNSKRWRAYNPHTDSARRKEARLAPPLIPPRFIANVAWKSKKASIPEVVVLKNGWEMRFYSSEGKPPRGVDLDLVHFDEEIVDGDWYPEMSSRLLDREGRFIWSACPQSATEAMYTLHERAEQERHKGEGAKVSEFLMLLDDNPHIGDEARSIFAAKMSDEERRVRYYGEYARTGYKVYPEFSVATHGIPYFPVPPDWCRYLIVDPGRQVCAVLFVAVPPYDHELSGRILLYDELYIRNCTAEIFGQKVKEKADNQNFHDFIIDAHESRKTETGSGKTIDMQYAQALKDNGIKSRLSGHGFTWGSDDLQGGISALRSWLFVRKSGTPKLMFFHEKLGNLIDEMKRYHYKRDEKNQLTDRPEQRDNHLCDTARYIAMYDPKYHKPPLAKPQKSGIAKILEEKMKRQRRMHGSSGVQLG